MSPGKTAAAPLAEIIARDCTLSDAARALLVDDQSAEAYVALLSANRLYADGLRFMAHRLPKRAALWWGCLCVWEIDRPEPSPATSATLQAVVDWIREPSEKHRRAADTAAEVAGLDSPAGALAQAVFLSGGSMSLPGLPAVAPDPLLTAKMVAHAVLLASWSTLPDQWDQCQRRFLSMAGEVVRNGAGLPPPAGSKPPM